MTALASPSRGTSLWQRWRFHLSALMLIVPILALPTFFDNNAFFNGKKGLGQREIGEIAVGPWSVRFAEFKLSEPDAEGRAGHAKEFALALCPACVDQVKAAYNALAVRRLLQVARTFRWWCGADITNYEARCNGVESRFGLSGPTRRSSGTS